jgi:spore coat protein U-like protein
MTPVRSLIIAMVALALLVDARPIAGVEQFPRGLMSAEPNKANRSCTIETRPLSFGNYDPLSETDVDAVGQVIYVCTNGNGGGGNASSVAATPKAIRIELDQGSSHSFDRREMVGPADRLQYNIYLDATRQTVWGTGVQGTQVYFEAQPPNKTPVTVPAFGRIFGRQDVAAGSYTDIVGVRIQF